MIGDSLSLDIVNEVVKAARKNKASIQGQT
jgi:hypothetical protein